LVEVRLDSEITVEACRGVSDAGYLLLILLRVEAIVDKRIDSGAALGGPLHIVDLIEESADSGIPNETGSGVGVGSPLTIELLNDESTGSGTPVLDKASFADCLLKMDEPYIESINSKDSR
jgi:hypothetical protein